MLSQETLNRIHEGMAVHDKDGDEIGNVVYIQFGDEDPDKPGPETQTAQGYGERDKGLVDDITEAFDSGKIPEELKGRLLRYGYIKIGQTLAADKYVPLDKVAEVSKEKVTLSATEAELFEPK